MVRPDGLLAAAPLVLRCAPDRLVVRQGFDLLVSDLVPRGADELFDELFCKLVRPKGFEPLTPWFEARRTVEIGNLTIVSY
jgi:hypothetical protein